MRLRVALMLVYVHLMAKRNGVQAGEAAVDRA